MILEAKMGEEFLKILVENAPIGCMLCEIVKNENALDILIKEINSLFEKELGIENMDIKARRWSRLQIYVKNDLISWLIEQKIVFQLKLNEVFERQIHENGRSFKLMVKKIGERHLIIYSIDMTEECNQMRELIELNEKLQLAGEELIIAKENAEKANILKSQFLANMSHEIRTPMNGILGYLELLETTQLDESQYDCLKEIKVASDMLLFLINDILDFSKIEAGKMSIEYAEFDVISMLKNVVSIFNFKILAKKIAFRVIAETAIPRKIIGDAGRIKQILNNLLGNAIKFTHAGEIVLTIRSEFLDTDKIKLSFDVMDTGIGIDNKNMDKLFQPFIQEDASTTRNYGGTGLGLAISKELVKLMGGNISVESQQGVGSVFSFSIIVQAALAHAEIGDIQPEEIRFENVFAENQEKNLAPSGENFLDFKILVAEDNEMNQRLIQKVLNRKGFNCELAKTGKEAVEALKRQRYDIVFMDCQMPEMDGYEATKYIRESEASNQHQYIVAMTANAMEGDRNKCIEFGMDDYISKPIDYEKLFELIQNRMKKKSGDISMLDTFIQLFLQKTKLEKEEALEIYSEYLKMLPTLIQEIDLNIAENKFNKVAQLAHQIKGTAGNLYILPLHNMATELEFFALDTDKENIIVQFKNIVNFLNENDMMRH